jgi:hypothetical protein
LNCCTGCVCAYEHASCQLSRDLVYYHGSSSHSDSEHCFRSEAANSSPQTAVVAGCEMCGSRSNSRSLGGQPEIVRVEAEVEAALAPALVAGSMAAVPADRMVADAPAVFGVLEAAEAEAAQVGLWRGDHRRVEVHIGRG